MPIDAFRRPTALHVYRAPVAGQRFVAVLLLSRRHSNFKMRIGSRAKVIKYQQYQIATGNRMHREWPVEFV